MAIDPLLMSSGTKILVSKLVRNFNRLNARLGKATTSGVNQPTFEGT